MDGWMDWWNDGWIDNFYGPLEIEWLGSKGRGMVLTRDVAAGELLLFEKAAFVYRLDQQVDTMKHVSSGDSELRN